MKEKFTPGEVVYFERSNDYTPRRNGITPVPIQKVGRLWVYFGTVSRYGQQRFDPGTMRVDGRGYSSPGRIWATQDEYDESVKREALQDRLFNLVYVTRNHTKISMADLTEIVSTLETAG